MQIADSAGSAVHPAAVRMAAAPPSRAADAAPALRRLLRAATAEPPVAAALTRSDAAASAGVPEAELVAAHAGWFDRAESPLAARRLRPRRREIAAALARFGSVRSVVGHRACRVERIAPAAPPPRWSRAYALEQRDPGGEIVRSVQFFDAAGHSLAEYAPRDADGVVAWLDLVEGCAVVEPRRPVRAALGVRQAMPAATDAANWCRAWAAQRGPAELDALLARHAMAPAAAFRLAAPAFARRLPATSAHELLAAAVQQGVRVAVEVPGAGACGGDWRTVRLAGGWTQAESGAARLHLREDAVAEAWLLRCPSTRGLRQTLWLLDADGAPIARFGAAGDAPEGCGWRRLVALLDAEADA